MKVNYLIPCWSGSRRCADPEYDKDPTIYLRSHLKKLENIEHNLSQITLVINHNPNESASYANYINSLPQKINETSLEVLKRDSNKGLTFGAWDYAHNLYRDAFDYYLFGEDDYLPVLNHFDKILIKEIKRHANCGFQCAGPVADNDLPMYAIGLSPEKCLAALRKKHGKLPYTNSESYSDVDLGWFFKMILSSTNFTIKGLINEHGNLYRVGSLAHQLDYYRNKTDRPGVLEFFGTGTTLFTPVQYA